MSIVFYHFTALIDIVTADKRQLQDNGTVYEWMQLFLLLSLLKIKVIVLTEKT